MHAAEAIMLDNWCRRDQYKSLKTSSSAWLVTYDFTSEKPKQSETLDALSQFRRVHQVNMIYGFMSCSCNFRNRYGIDCPHVYHVVSQSKHFKETNNYHISVRW